MMAIVLEEGKEESNATGKTFSLDSYHYFVIKDGKISQSGDFFDATGMVMAVSPDEETTE
jgi:ketosteroid isomerase-like protein